MWGKIGACGFTAVGIVNIEIFVSCRLESNVAGTNVGDFFSILVADVGETEHPVHCTEVGVAVYIARHL